MYGNLTLNSVPLSAIYLSDEPECPAEFAARGLRGGFAATMSGLDGNLNQGTNLGESLYLCTSTTAQSRTLAGGANSTIVLMGSHFAATGNIVRIGETECTIVSESTKEIRCHVDNGVGHGLVEIETPGLGHATHNFVEPENLAARATVHGPDESSFDSYDSAGNVVDTSVSVDLVSSIFNGELQKITDTVSYASGSYCTQWYTSAFTTATSAYVVIELTQPEEIHSIQVAAWEGYESYLSGLQVFVSEEAPGAEIGATGEFENSDNMVSCGTEAELTSFVANDVIDVTCDNGAVGKYITIVRPQQTALLLCEVSAFGREWGSRDSPSEFEFVTSIDSVNGQDCHAGESCIELGLEGGTTLTIQGEGFGKANLFDVNIHDFLGGSVCEVTSHSEFEIVCISSRRPRPTDFVCSDGLAWSGVSLYNGGVVAEVSGVASLAACQTECDGDNACNSITWNTVSEVCTLYHRPKL